MRLTFFPNLLRRCYGFLFTHARVILNGKEETLWLYKERWQIGPSATLGGTDLTKQEPQTRFVQLDPAYLRDYDWESLASFEAQQNLPYVLDEIVWIAERTQVEGRDGITITFWKQ